MKNQFKPFLLLSICLFSFVQVGFSQKKSKWWHRFNPDSMAAKDWKVLPSPNISLSPETGLAFGGFVDYFYDFKRGDSTVRPSLSFVNFLYSTNKQLTADVFTSTYTPKERYFIGFRGGFVSNYEKYWGLTSPTLPNKKPLEVTFDRTYAAGRVARNIGNRMFAGVNFYYSYYNSFKFDTLTDAAQTPFQIASPNSRSLGYGLVFSIDRRDNQFSPSKGFLVDISTLRNQNLDNSTRFNQVQIDLRRYDEVGKHTFAHQFLVSTMTGDVPVFEKNRLGGHSLMRGFFQGRFRDDNMWSLQTEYRYAVSPLIKIAPFVAVGGTSPDWTTLFGSQLRLGGGVGARWLINRAKALYVRADVAFSDIGSFGYYIRIGDAF